MRGLNLLNPCLDNTTAIDDSECNYVGWTSPLLDAIAMRLVLPGWIYGLAMLVTIYNLYNTWTHLPADSRAPIRTPMTVRNDNAFTRKDERECTYVGWISPLLDAFAIDPGLPGWMSGLAMPVIIYNLYNTWTSLPADSREPILTPMTVRNDNAFF